MTYRCEFISAESGDVLAVTTDPVTVTRMLRALAQDQGGAALDRYQLRIVQEMTAKQHFLQYVSPRVSGRSGRCE